MKVKQDAPDPEEDESHGEFMDRCISEMTSDDENLDESEAEEACQIAWDEQRSAAGVVHKNSCRRSQRHDVRAFRPERRSHGRHHHGRWLEAQ